MTIPFKLILENIIRENKIIYQIAEYVYFLKCYFIPNLFYEPNMLLLWKF